MSYIFKDGSLLWVGGSVASSPNCCCGTPIPANCDGLATAAYRGRACASDWSATYPNDPGDNAAFAAYLAPTQVDLTLPTGFAAGSTSDCSAACATLDAATYTLPYSANTIWRTETASWCAADSRILTFTISCSTITDACILLAQLIINSAFDGGTAMTARWQKTITDQINFSALNEDLPFLNYADPTGGNTCTYDMSGVAHIAIH